MIVVVAFHGCIGIGLCTMPHRAAAPAAQDVATMVYFIEPDPEPVMAAVAANTRGAPVQRKPTFRSPGVQPDPAPVPAMQALDLTLPIPPMRFARDPLRRRSDPGFASKNRLHLEMRDNSISGIMQRMTKASICGDLRRALTTSMASAGSILASMRRYNCRI